VETTQYRVNATSDATKTTNKGLRKHLKSITTVCLAFGSALKLLDRRYRVYGSAVVSIRPYRSISEAYGFIASDIRLSIFNTKGTLRPLCRRYRVPAQAYEAIWKLLRLFGRAYSTTTWNEDDNLDVLVLRTSRVSVLLVRQPRKDFFITLSSGTLEQWWVRFWQLLATD